MTHHKEAAQISHFLDTDESTHLLRLHSWFPTVTQFLTWPFLFVGFHLFFNIHIQGRANLKKFKAPAIFISNHIRFYDSFLFRLVLGLFTPHLPLRFMGVKKFEWAFLNFLRAVGIIRLVYALFGVFTVVRGEGIEKGLREAKIIIGQGENVVIYPEGRITHNAVGTFLKGAVVLARESKVPVVPVSFRLVANGLIRGHLSINIGEPVHLTKGTVEDETLHFQNVILTLYNRV